MIGQFTYKGVDYKLSQIQLQYQHFAKTGKNLLFLKTGRMQAEPEPETKAERVMIPIKIIEQNNQNHCFRTSAFKPTPNTGYLKTVKTGQIDVQ